MATMANKNSQIISSTDVGIIVKETQVIVSDEKIHRMLSQSYEKAIQDASHKFFYDYYSYYLSFAGTMLLTLLTADFHALGGIDADKLQTFAIILTIISAIVGFVFLGFSVSRKREYHTESRDKAVNEIVNQHLGDNDR